MVTTVSEGRVLPFMVAVTVTDVALSSSPRLLGLALSVMPVGAPSSSVMVVVTDEVPSVGVAPPPDGLDIVTVNVSSDSSTLSSVVCTVNVLSAWSACVNVSMPDLAV